MSISSVRLEKRGNIGLLIFDQLNEGQNVEFETEADPRDPNRSRAINVRAQD